MPEVVTAEEVVIELDLADPWGKEEAEVGSVAEVVIASLTSVGYSSPVDYFPLQIEVVRCAEVDLVAAVVAAHAFDRDSCMIVGGEGELNGSAAASAVVVVAGDASAVAVAVVGR